MGCGGGGMVSLRAGSGAVGPGGVEGYDVEAGFGSGEAEGRESAVEGPEEGGCVGWDVVGLG